MIISHRHKYLFVELPLTGSTAIANELLEHYAGERVLMKHSTYEDFRRATGDKCEDYFVFSGVRHPLDQVVSQYAKLRSDHKGKFSKLSDKRRARGLHFVIHWWFERRKFRFVALKSADFDDYFRRFYRLPYSDWSLLSHREFNALIRFENLIEDFEMVLKALNIHPIRELPIRNRSMDKGAWEDYFQKPDTRTRAVRLFGPFMSYWNYEFPIEWDRREPSSFDRLLFFTVNVGRKVYWRYLRYRF